MKRTIGALALITLSAASFADITFVGMGPFFESATISGHRSGTFESGLLHFSDPSNNLGLGTNFNTICVDLDDTIGGGQQWPASLLHSNTLGDGLQSAGNIISKYINTISTNDQASGLQLAAWEAVYDHGLLADFSHGNFIVDNADAGALQWAATYYNNGVSDPGDAMYLRPQTGSGGQGQMTSAPVPEPASCAVLALGILAIRKRRCCR